MIAGSLFSGHGQLDYGLTLAGIEHAWFCEADEWRRGILAKRWPGVPVFDDVRAVDRSVPGVDLLVGGFPCRGASTAGDRAGMGNPETALWREMARVIRELRPRLILLENVANLLAVQRGAAWGEVLGDLAEERYVVAWDCLPAAAFGAPHLRDRVFAVASLADGEDEQRRGSHREGADGWSDVGRGACGPSSDADEPRTAADPNGHALRQQPESEQGGCGPSELGIAGGWGSYGAAVTRWEEVAGAAPQPLLRGVDARPARRVVRSRLSALGDGVQVQAGEFLGKRLMELAPA